MFSGLLKAGEEAHGSSMPGNGPLSSKRMFIIWIVLYVNYEEKYILLLVIVTKIGLIILFNLYLHL